ncbi:MAG: hypothetical protein JSV55_13450 [Deltaproteobacteria bacterium]|nr:MAG: hypothetical protein JSV55_13450 [Deltaproteobacteria bacterium]
MDKAHQLTTQRLRKNSGEKEIPNEHGGDSKDSGLGYYETGQWAAWLFVGKELQEVF